MPVNEHQQLTREERTEATGIKAIELDWYADDETVRVTPRDQRRFNIQKDRAIEILQQQRRSEEFGKQFDLLLSSIVEWVNRHSGQVKTAIVTLQDGVLTLVIVRPSARYDEDLQDSLADFEFEIANDADLHLINLNTLALPPVSPDAMASFLDERLVLRLRHHGDRS